MIREPTTRAELLRFAEFAAEVYATAPHWVPVDVEYTVSLLLGTSASSKDQHSQAFWIEDGGAIVARVAAVMVNDAEPELGVRVGHLVLFEAFAGCGEAATHLLDHACAWLAAHGAHDVRLSCLDGWQMPLSLDGLERPAVGGTSYTPSYYPTLIQAAGFEPEWGLGLYCVELGPARVAELERVVASASDRGVRIRPMDSDRLDEEVDHFHRLYNASFRRHPGYTPLTHAQLREEHEDNRAHGFEDFSVFAEIAGETVGFCYATPDTNQQRLASRHGQQIVADQGLRVATGVLTSVAGRGIGTALGAAAMCRMAHRGYRRCFSMVYDSNAAARAQNLKLGTTEPVGRFTTFRRRTVPTHLATLLRLT